MKYLIVFCLGVLAVQAQDPIGDLIKELEDLNREVTSEQKRATDRFGDELKSLDQLTGQILRDVGEELRRDSGNFEKEIRDLEREAREYRVDISECVGASVETIGDLPDHFLGEAGVCISLGHAEAERAVNEGVRHVDQAIGPIDEYWKRLERCSGEDRPQQAICVAELKTEIKNDEVEIPSKIHLAVEEVIGHLEDEKVSLRLCGSDQAVKLNREGKSIVGRVTDCAERLFPSRPNPPRH